MSIDNDKAISPLEMQGLDRNRFNFDDLALLKSGQFSDAQLTLGDKTWQVHKSILCPRSGYMQDVLSPYSIARIEEAGITEPTEEHIDQFLEFIYSGSIESLHYLTLGDCVDLCEIGQVLRVDGMICYTVNILWDKLTPMLQALSSTPAIRDTEQSWRTIAKTLGYPSFVLHFKLAVTLAYLDYNNACQLALADFVWAARAWLPGDRIIQELTRSFPQFGSHILTTMQKGPQSPFLLADKLLKDAATAPTSTLCPNCAHAQV